MKVIQIPDEKTIDMKLGKPVCHTCKENFDRKSGVLVSVIAPKKYYHGDEFLDGRIPIFTHVQEDPGKSCNASKCHGEWLETAIAGLKPDEMMYTTMKPINWLLEYINQHNKPNP